MGERAVKLHGINSLVRLGATTSVLALSLGGTAFAQDTTAQTGGDGVDSNTIIVTGIAIWEIRAKRRRPE